MTVKKEARMGKITRDMKTVAEDERIDAEKLRKKVAKGRIVITKNIARKNSHVIGVGEGLRTKVNANVGTSTDFCDIKYETKKAKIAVRYGADTVMDLSTSGNLDKIRSLIMNSISVPVGTVPIYQAAVEALQKYGALINMTEDDVLKVIEEHAKDGVDFMTVHAGITRSTVESLKKTRRVTGIVSRGGVFLASWILHHKAENPLYKNFDYILEVAKEYDFCISLGDALRPGCIADASDWFQLQELLTIGKLVEKCREADVQVMVEGPGHVPLNQVEANVILAKTVCKGAPFYVLGPLTTDIGAGYDHIVGAIGGALAGIAGADFLCYVTPSEHLGLPTLEDVRQGVVATKIAAHSADIVTLGNKVARRDLEIAEARSKLDWKSQYKLFVDPEKARETRMSAKKKTDACSMCGEYCVYKILSPRHRSGKRELI